MPFWPRSELSRPLCGVALLAVVSATIAGPASVVDGDTIAIRRQRIRLFGIDAPEIGLWRGTFVPPWDWRQSQRQGTANAAGSGRIKGNVSATGERIYHVPGGRFYDRTQIGPLRGERWFCSDAEARAAGWRRSRQ